MNEQDQNHTLAKILQETQKRLPQPPEGMGFACRPVKFVMHEHSAAIGRFKGELGLPVLAEFTAAMNDLLGERVQKVILDFSEVTISNSAMGVLVAFAATIHGLNKRLYLYQASAQIKEQLASHELTKFFVFIEEEDDIVMTLVV